ncbi:glycosyltransferase [Devosia sp.]|uniref:glycosyltransferase n=1 Tax=Devosia sp. TaxID=1871048 RepID=UPI0035B2DF79
MTSIGARPSDVIGRPFWSVMIPVYRPNVEFLRQAIASVSGAAGRESMQIALVQDQSDRPDEQGLGTLIEECRDLGVEVFAPIGRLGIGANWNRCIDLARGQVVHILHQDDRVRPGFYGANEDALTSSPSLGASFTQHAFIASDGSVLREGQLRRDQAGVLDDWYEHIVANLAIQCPAIVVKRRVYEQLGGFDTTYRYCLDRAMWQRIAASFPVWFEPRVLAEYRVHGQSASAAMVESLTPWREVRRCLAEGLRLVAPSARTLVARSAHFHLARLALTEVGQSIGSRRWRAALAGLVGLVSMTRPTDYLRVIAKTYPRAPLVRNKPGGTDEPSPPRKRVVLVTEFFPSDPKTSVFGAFLRLRSLLEGLGTVGELDIVFYWPPGYDATATEERAWDAQVRSLWPISGEIRFVRCGRRTALVDGVTDAIWALRGAVGFFEPRPSMRTSSRQPVAHLRRVLAELQPDLILAHRLGVGAALLRVGAPMAPVVVDIDDLEHVKMGRLARSLPFGRRRVTKLVWSAVARYATRQVARISARLLVTSELDRGKLQKLCPETPVVVIPNTASTVTRTQVAHSARPVALFVGTLDYPPNAEGVTWLIDTVWPSVRRALPEARLVIAGAGKEHVGANAAERVELLGFVEDLGPLYEAAQLTVCPILRGAGTRIKIVEAALNGRPTVSTSVGAEGLSFVGGTEIFLADDPEEFARSCIALLRDTELSNRVGQAARQRAMLAHDSLRVTEALAVTCREVLADASPTFAPELQ